MRVKICSFLLVVLFSSCSKTTELRVSPTLITSLIEDVFPYNLDGKYIFLDTTSLGEEFEAFMSIYLSNKLDKDSIGTLESFIAELKVSNGEPWILEKDEKRTFKIGYESGSSVDPIGYFQLTEVCRVSDSEYLLYLAMYCGSDCSSGSLINLENSSGDWVINHVEFLWGG